MATPSVTFGDSSPKPTPKKYFVFFWGPRGRSQGIICDSLSLAALDSSPNLSQKNPASFFGSLEGAKGSDGSNNKKRKTPAGFPAGAFLAIGLSINQTVVS